MMQADFEPMRFTKSKPQIETMNHNIKKMGRRVKKKEKSLDLSYIEVAVALPVFHTFTYSIPETFAQFISPGKRVLVPFGRRVVTGYILGPSKAIQGKKIKRILDVLDDIPLFPAGMIPFFKWISNYYIYPLGETIKSTLPGGLNLYDFTTLSITQTGQNATAKHWVNPFEKEILSCLKQGSCRLKDLRKNLKKEIPNALIQTLEDSGWLIKKKGLKGGRTRPRLKRFVSITGSDVPSDQFVGAKKRIIDIVRNEGEISVKSLTKAVPSASKLISALETEQVISIFKKRVYRDPFGEHIKPDIPPNLTDEQNRVISRVTGALGKGFSTFLLAGVTGSGKTEVYMQLVAAVLQQGLSALVLVPEITLISQIERRFRARFGDCVALLHSGLSSGERYDQWIRIVSGKATIAIGARSAVFAPCTGIGIVIVDEEHDTSYKQDHHFRYHARDIAVVRAMLHGCVVLLGSATPSIQSYYHVTQSKFKEVSLKIRVEKRPLPEVTIVDLGKNRNLRGIRRFITPELYKAMGETLGSGEQVLLFLNRRGFAGFPVCSACGAAVRCKNCDISLTFHQSSKAYLCHYCGYTRFSASNCAACGSSQIKNIGWGTEKVESAVKTLFPNARVARMDHDTTQRKGAILSFLKGLKNQTIDVLVGTQIVAKGHDFPNITLVGIICADLSLSFPDFRAGERTFQLLAQVSGRSGRGSVPGKVILQTFNPDHFSILSARKQDFKAFFSQEIGFRKSLNYPPFSRMIQLKISGKNKQITRAHAMAVGSFCNRLRKRNTIFLKSVEMLGPIEAPLPKIAKRFRWQILFKGSQTKILHRFARQLLFQNTFKLNTQNVRVVIDVDPYMMM